MTQLGPQPVPEALRPFVSSFIAYDVTSEPGVHRGLPGTALTFVLPIDDPIDVAWANRPESRRASWSSLAGLHAAPAEIRHHGSQRGFFLALTVAGSRALLGQPAGELGGQLSDLDELAPGLADLPERLHDTGNWDARRRIVEASLLAARERHSAPRPRPRPEVSRALHRLTAGAPVDQVADDVGYSSRHLRNLVRAETGLGPKEWQRVARFERSRTHVVAAGHGRMSMADAADRAGYADQAHLTREWRELAGCPPSQWLREELTTSR